MPYPIKRTLSAEAVRHFLDYDPASGVFRWRIQRRRIPAGHVAGSLKQSGYIYIHIGNELWAAHRLAWLHFYGCHPGDMLDHINRIKHDNRISNLRETTYRENSRNATPCRNRNPDLLGVRQRQSGAWGAQISVNNRIVGLGTFPSREAARAAFDAAAVSLRR